MSSVSNCHAKRISFSSVCIFSIIVVLISATTKTAEISQKNYSDLCNQMALSASKNSTVPASVLLSITLAETGRKRDGDFQPWPWTVNMEGKGVWFDNPNSAIDFANKNFHHGARSFDVGCFQLNYRWHGQKFSSIEDMFDPEKNALYAAKFLEELYLEKGNWDDAAAAYHSRTPKFANRYKARFRKLHSRFLAQVSSERQFLRINKDRIGDVSSSSKRSSFPNFFPLPKMNSSVKVDLGSLYSTKSGIGAFWNDG